MNWEELTKKIVDGMGFRDYHIEIKPEEKRGSLFIYDGGNFFKREPPEHRGEHQPYFPDGREKERRQNLFFLT